MMAEGAVTPDRKRRERNMWLSRESSKKRDEKIQMEQNMKHKWVHNRGMYNKAQAKVAKAMETLTVR